MQLLPHLTRIDISILTGFLITLMKLSVSFLTTRKRVKFFANDNHSIRTVQCFVRNFQRQKLDPVFFFKNFPFASFDISIRFNIFDAGH
jgi:hypothetical protein